MQVHAPEQLLFVYEDVPPDVPKFPAAQLLEVCNGVPAGHQ